MLVKTFKEMSDYILNGFYDQDENEKALKTYLIYTFTIVGFLFLFPLGVSDFLTANNLISLILLGICLVLLLNFFYLRRTENYVVAGNIIFYTFFILMFYLVYTGGIDNTGHLWIYCLPPMALFLHGLKKGLLELSVFVLFMILLFYAPHELIIAQYEEGEKLRIILSFLVVTFLTSLYEYSRVKSIKKMKKLQKDLKFFLKQDELTGLYNRRGYNDNIEKIGTTNGVVLMCDIDHFKKINDSFGHAAGDHVIKEVATCIRNTIRKDDVAVRWGGEEFLVFLTKTNIDNAYFVSEKLRESIEELHIHYKDRDIRVTVSIGIASVGDTTTLDDAIRFADNAMYLSKSSGRNRISKHNLNLY